MTLLSPAGSVLQRTQAAQTIGPTLTNGGTPLLATVFQCHPWQSLANPPKANSGPTTEKLLPNNKNDQ